ncbi:MAG: matrixin family metalloprotease [Betaproteobacteria bacterium]|nr:matrixin family metalloprotease [Betaproteobacteria bacterium]
MLRLILSATCLLLATLTFHGASAYVFLSAHKPRLKPQDGRQFYFYLTPEAPRFVDKDSFEEGIYADSTDAQNFALLVERSMAVWNEIPGLGIELKISEERSGKIDETDNQFSIGIGKINTVASGLAYPLSDESDPTRIRDCDIQVGEDITSIPVFIFVMIHELGHCLGLGHNHSDPSAIMGYWQPRGLIQLGLDDMAGVLSLYPPRSGERTKTFAPCGTLALATVRNKGFALQNKSAHDNARGNSSWALLLAMGLAPVLFWGLLVIRPWSYRRRQRTFVR